MSDLIKADDLGFVDQLNNFSNKIGGYQALFGLDAAVITSVQNDAAYMSFVLAGTSGSDTYKQAWTGLKKDTRNGKGTDPMTGFPTPVDVSTPPTAVAPGIEGRFRSLATQIKAHPSYTVGIGEDLGIVADEDTTTLTAPKLKVEMVGGSPVISFNKSKSDGIRLYSMRGTEKSFGFLAVDTRSPYVDNRPNEEEGIPETRQYYAFYIKADEQVGSQSDTVSVSV